MFLILPGAISEMWIMPCMAYSSIETKTPCRSTFVTVHISNSCSSGNPFFRKKGFPEEHELLICTVTKVDLQGVFVSIDEYAIQGMIHISEIAPGRIRNIRDYVKEGKVIVC